MLPMPFEFFLLMADQSGNSPASSSRGRGRRHRLSVTIPSPSSTIPPTFSTFPVPPVISPLHTTTTPCSPGGTMSPPLYSGPPIHAPCLIMYTIPPPTYSTSPTVHSSSPQLRLAAICSSPRSSTGTVHLASPHSSSDGKAVLILDGEGFLPSHPAANAITDIMRRHFEEPWVSWKRILHGVKDMWFDEFKRRYQFQPPDDMWACHNFERRGAARLKNLLATARRVMERPSWLGELLWNRLCEHWRTAQYQEKSEKAKENKASDIDGFGPSHHTYGSITTSQHRYNLTSKTGTVPSPSELFIHTHHRKDKTWVDRRSEHICSEFRRNMEESQSQSSADSSQHQTPLSELDVWIRTVGEKKKGRLYGLGLESTALMPTSKFPGQSSFPVQWLNSKEFQEQVQKQVEDEVKEVNAWVQAAEQKRDELRRRVEHNE